MARTARAIHHAHQRGILHRDLKPANILLDPAGEPMVADFGLARRIADQSKLTLSGMVMGSPNYMAPEQVSSGAGEITTAADVYSLGAIFYELLAGQPPFVADTPMQTMRKVVDDEPVLPSRLHLEAGVRDTKVSRLGVPGAAFQDLETICLKCLQKDPARRYTSAAALAEDLELWLRGEPILARPTGAAERVWKWFKRRPAIAALIGLSIVALVGFLVLQKVNEAGLTRERDLARHQERRATSNELRALAEARRAESNALTAQLNLYAADIHSAAQLVEAGQVGPALALLQQHEPAPGQVDVRGFEWHWLHARCQGQPATVLRGHNRAVATLAFSPDGRRLASGEHRKVLLWDTVTWQRLAAFPDPYDRAVWEAKGAQGLELMQREPRKALDLLLGRAALEREIAPSRPDVAHATRALAFSPDGRALLTAGDQEYVKFWDAAAGQLRGWYPEKGADAAFLPDGRVLAQGRSHPAGRTVEIVEATTGKLLQTLLTNGSRFVLSANSRWLVILKPRQELVVWDVSNRIESARFRLAAPIYGRPAITSDGRRLAAIAEGREQVRIYDRDAAWRSSATDELGSQAQALAFSPDDHQLAIGMRDSTVRLHDAAGGTGESAELRRFTGHHAPVTAVAWGPRGELVSASVDGTVRVWSLAEQPGQDGALRRFTSFVVAPTGEQFAGAGEGGRIMLWDGRAREAQALSDREGFKPLAFRLEESALLVGQRAGDTQVRLEFWRLTNGAVARELTLEGGRNLLASPRGDRVVLWDAGEAVVYDTDTGAELARFLESRQGFQSESTAVFDGERFLVRTFPVGVTVWQVAEGRRTAVLRLPENVVPDAIAAAPDGATVVTGDSDSLIRVWDAREGRVLHKLPAHSGGLKAVAVSLDGRTLASVGEDRVLMLWSLPTGRELMTLSRGVAAGRLRFLPDSHALLGATTGRGVQLWRADGEASR
jgi:WD40 repeat protein